ncbi:hydrolase family protein / HAD-superfamily protein isoform 1 [Galdieria sulphuraria]|uniref:Hydrolase family protein / HAD-superfamily protein isoform 1 n=1 Tax=Galdieria sulphuraria TaxID=130081 RepID=M2WY00_GALSU|nr:hydrolase family protein / HAD-superfamily protein isoform 1 [Galdieria sulphuraria]EME28940.1 hydrolase family protein / HAD-superfamily protein isoform 1 [Galdieria sulphuraria]|eukprot:XP_005705460.1 hydrolase family protein / HAD-superfamily protein isoform 1 [Galdieria sulphuraria]
MSDSTDWGRDIQIICDILQSNSRVVFSTQEEVQVYFTNPDFIWANEFPFPRFGQGAFRLALEKIYQELVGKPLPYIQYGKPCAVQYRFMEDLLRKQAISQGYTDLEVIYAIGDNPAADIRGARNAGKPWIPILVKTGCFSTNDGDNDPNDPADYVFQDVNEAISTLVQKLSSS